VIENGACVGDDVGDDVADDTPFVFGWNNDPDVGLTPVDLTS
jgi:hypothetical protein